MSEFMVAEWQRELSQKVAEAFANGERAFLTWPRRAGKRAFRDQLDRDMAAQGWMVLAPGVYQPPKEAPDA